MSNKFDLLNNHSYLKTIEEYSQVSKTDINGVITEVTDSFCKISGYSREELIGQKHNILKSPHIAEHVYKELWETILSGKAWKGEIQSKAKDASLYWMSLVIFPHYDEDHILIGFAVIRHNITDTKVLEYQAIRDGLTELFNRRYYNEVAEKELMRAKREKQNFTFVMMDIDFFKLYNDTYGHNEGDKALQEVAKVLTKYLSRAGDFCFRLGGEEFGLFYTGSQAKESLEYTQKICHAIEDLCIPHSKNKVSQYLTASFGLVNMDMSSTIIDENAMYVAADNQLYKAKQSGRNRVVMLENNQIELF